MPVTSVTLDGYQKRAEHVRTPPLTIGAAAPAAAAGGGYMTVRPGEALLTGTRAQMRAVAAAQGRRTFVPVHYRLEADWELLGLEPRGFGPGAASGGIEEDRIDLRVRLLAARAMAEPVAAEAEPWQRLQAALRQEQQVPGAGVAAMAQLAQTAGLHPLWQGLALRNLVVMLARQGAQGEALTLVEQARQAHPEYRELDWLAAKLLLSQGVPQEALHALERAMRTGEGAAAAAYVGSGGEAGYRAHYLMAEIGRRAGHQAMAIYRYLAGVRARPAYEPSVVGLLQERAPLALLGVMDGPLLHLGRVEPRYQTAIFAWWLLHRRWELAARALRIWPMAEETRQQAQAQLTAVDPRPQKPRATGERAGVVLQGPFLMVASSARINRYLAGALLGDRDLDAALEPSLAGEEPEAAFPTPAGWARGLRQLPRRLDVTIRHGWPPLFTPPEAGKLAMILPWEFGTIPRRWVAPLNRTDAIWVPSVFVQDVLVRAGVDHGRIAVIPNGVNQEIFRPEGAAARPAGARGTCFLFVGGAIARKGIDVLLTAWRQAFRADDDVTLVIKDMGATTFYRHLSLADEIVALAQEPQIAPIVYKDASYTETELAALYRGCDVVVQPYRGEGFGMPLAEALACGRPVIATKAGPAPEFCPAASTWWITAQEQDVPETMRLPEPVTGPLTWFEPEVESLVEALRAAASADPQERERRGTLGAAHMHAHYGWDDITQQYGDHLKALL